ncbi:hypothetical protein SDC9_108159 [bioreactor metagenome]|uniref:DUF1659 domain-containing protein n=2 Tax=root TaxID=1 RepID=A0ABS4K5C1_9CLOT|nr:MULTISPECIES: DUF1659 domain-containing protein [Clostridium]EQB89544.1 hypothetical protein M918_20130 [Clostridium sp. BL8]MBP2022976.1 hypothetical protein [Clostridium punense]
MAISKVLNSATLSIEVENGTDKTGATVYRKKNFSGIKLTADPQNVFDVAEAIKVVLKPNTRDYYLTESSKLTTP